MELFVVCVDCSRPDNKNVTNTVRLEKKDRAWNWVVDLGTMSVFSRLKMKFETGPKSEKEPIVQNTGKVSGKENWSWALRQQESLRNER